MIHPSFRGLPNFRRLYNNEVRSFLISGSSLNGGSSNYGSSLGSSIISSKGDLTYLEISKRSRYQQKNEAGAQVEETAELGPDIQGTFWSAQEKELFFTLLSRYSIHQVDLIVDQLPYKSTIEVLNYYQLLKNELRRLKKRVGGSPSHYHKVKIRMNSNQRPFTHSFRIEKTYSSLVSMKDMPIAYEMSDRFIKMEEIQARLLLDKEKKIVNDGHKHFIDALDSYDRRATTNAINRRLKRDLIVSPSTESALLPVNEDDSLIDIDNCHALSRRMFQEFKDTSKFIKVHYPPIVLLEQLTKLYTRDLILKLMMRKMNKEWLGSSYSDEFTDEDVLEVIDIDPLRIEYLSDKRKKVKTKKEAEEEEQEEEEVHNIIIEEVDDPPLNGADTPPLHISQLPQNRPAMEPQIETSINKLITNSLHNQETKVLNKHDLQASKNYEHILLTSLTTYRDDDPEVENSMYDIDTAFDIVLDEGLDDGTEDSADDNELSMEVDENGVEAEIENGMLEQFMRLYPNYIE